MAPQDYFTTREIAGSHGIAIWQVRRAVDALGVLIPRIGLYRAVPRRLLPRLRRELRRRGWLPAGTAEVQGRNSVRDIADKGEALDADRAGIGQPPEGHGA
jgi:hypothetical protein